MIDTGGETDENNKNTDILNTFNEDDKQEDKEDETPNEGKKKPILHRRQALMT